MGKFENQKGLSSILFAMIFALVLSLLAVGFATLLRNDSRQTLDQTLGYQAQYAAESGVNQAAEKIKATLAEQNSCASLDLGLPGDQVKITCVTWNKAPDVQFSDLTNEPQPFKLNITGSGNPASFIFKWTLKPDAAAPTGFGVYGASGYLPNPINFNNMPILKVSIIVPGQTDHQIYYFVPTSAGGSGNYGSSGSVFSANCGGATSNNCSFTLGGLSSAFNGGYMAVSVIGRSADDLIIETSSNSFDGVQWQVDSTAIALDVSKRVQARVDPIGATWRPGNAVSTDEICKDIKVDGGNTVGISGNNTCATRLITP